MIWTNIRRVFRAGFIGFWRNGFVSLASVLVMTVALFVIGSIVLSGALFKATLVELQDKADINVYFVTTAPEGDILSLKETLEKIPEVASVDYVSREEAFDNFKDRHSDDLLMSQVFDILGDNPLGASLTIKAKQVSQYENIASFLSQSDTAISSTDGTPIIDDINYYRNQVVIKKLTRIIDSGQRLGYALGVALLLISIIITFNTIRLAVYISREEITVMNLVGASHRYVRGPFVVSGIMYGVVAAILSLSLLFVASFWLGGMTEKFFTGINAFEYYIDNFGQMFLTIFLSGIVLGGISSYLAVRRYLKI